MIDLLENRDPDRFRALFDALPPAMLELLADLSPLGVSAQLRAPVELVVPPHDQYFPLGEAEALARSLPNVHLDDYRRPRPHAAIARAPRRVPELPALRRPRAGRCRWTMSSPPATNVLLVATLVVTIAAVAEFLRRAEGGGDVSAETTGAFLALFTVLFAMRVAGQLVVRRAAPRWLPPMDRWNLMPYRLLLPIQLVLLAVMSWIVSLLARRRGTPRRAAPRTRALRRRLRFLYAGSMVVRYAVRMRRRPGERWFGGADPDRLPRRARGLPLHLRELPCLPLSSRSSIVGRAPRGSPRAPRSSSSGDAPVVLERDAQVGRALGDGVTTGCASTPCGGSRGFRYHATPALRSRDTCPRTRSPRTCATTPPGWSSTCA